MSRHNCQTISQKNHRGLFAFLISALIATTAYNAQAVTYLWNNTGTQYTSATSWTNGVAPASNSSSATTDDIQFGSVAAGFNSVELTSSRAAAGMTFLAGANAYTISPLAAQKLSISYGLTNNSTATQTFNTLLENAQGNNTWTQVAGGNLVFNNGVALGTSSTSRTVTLAGGGTFTFNSGITQNVSTGSKLTVNNVGGVVNLNAANAIGGATGGGIVITAGQVNFSNAQSLGTGLVELGATTGTATGSSILNNVSGSAIALTGLTGVTWSGVSPAGIQIGTSASTANSNIDFGSGTVTASSSRSMNIAGTGVTITMGTLGNISAADGRIFTFDGTGNNMIFRGFKISTTSVAGVTNNLAGSANLQIAGVIENGSSFANGLQINSTGTTTFSGNNTYDGRTTMNAAAGALTLSGDNSGAAGGVTLTAGTLNINNNNALGSGALSLAGAGARINNTSGSAVVNAGNQAWAWNDGLTFGSSTNIAANNLNLGTGVVTVAGSRTIALEGTGTKLTIGAANITSTTSGRTITANGIGNTLEMEGLTLSASLTPTTVTVAGTANIGVTGAIVNGTTPGNGVTVTSTGANYFSGNNTYTGLTTMNAAAGTLTLSGNNSGAAGGVTLTAGTLNINNNNALGSGALNLAGAGATINNTSGSAVVNAGNQSWSWTDGLAFGASGNTAANNLNLGTGVVTASSTRTIALAGTGTKLTMGAVNISSTSSGRTITANGVGNTLEMGGLTLSASLTPTTVTLAGTANIGVTGAIVNGTTPDNGVTVTSTGANYFSGNNTYTGLTTMNAAAGTLTLSGDNSGAAGGVTLTAGTLNINNNNALGSGALNLAGAGARINNTSGSAVVNAGNQAWAWNDGLTYGSSTSTAANNLNLGTGVVTVAGSRTIALEGTGTKLTIGAANITSTSSGRTITANGIGNTLEMEGLTLSGNTTAAVTVNLAGTANLGVTGDVVNGQAFANGVNVTGTGTNTFSGNNTYTGSTTISAGTAILSGNNSAATGSLFLGGASSTLDKPLVKLNSVNAISSSSTISGSSSSDRVGTLDFNAGTAYTLNSYTGGTMNFTNSFGQNSVVTFTNSASILTSSAGSTGGRSLQNNSANLDIVFNGSLDIGSSATDTVNTIGGAGDFVVKGNIFSTTAGSVRGLSKTGSGLLEMRGDNNNYNGNTTIFNGTISVTNGAVLTGTTVRVAPSSGNSGTLLVNGTAGAVVVSARGILAGGGTVGAVTLESGAILNPGNSPGLLTASSATWAAGSTYNWEINNATGAAGTNWDVFSVTGALDMSALSSAATMNLVLNSLSIANYSTSSSYTWVIAQAGSFIGTGLANGTDVTSLFNINTAAFNGGLAANLPNGGFQVVTGTEGSLRTLNLLAVPEPSTGSMLGLGFAGLVLTRLLRRKNS